MTDDVDRFFEAMMRRFESFFESEITPLTHVVVYPEHVVVTADMPFADPGTIDLRLIGERHLRIEAKLSEASKRTAFFAKFKRAPAAFKCVVELPVPVSAISSFRIKHDILEVVLVRKFE